MAIPSFRERRNMRNSDEQNKINRVDSNRQVDKDELDILLSELSETYDSVDFDVDKFDPVEKESEFKEQDKAQNTNDVMKFGFESVKKQTPNNTIYNPKKIVRIGIILDCTLSFTKVYSKVFYILDKVLKGIKEVKKEYKAVEIEYGLVTIHDTADVYYFSDNKCFTSYENDFIYALKTLEFWGGSHDGQENLEDAINKMLYVLNSQSDCENVNNGLLMFTDSTQKKENTKYNLDFSSNEPNKYGDYTNYGLRFANIYAYDDDFMPAFNIVDHYGNYAENNKNKAIYSSLKDLLDKDADETISLVQNMIENILNQMSVN